MLFLICTFREDMTSVITISEKDSVESRLDGVLKHLTIVQLDGGWNSFADGLWRNDSRVVFAGEGEGGSLAAFWSCRVEAMRVLLFGAPFDRNIVEDSVDAWLSESCATSKDNMFALYHTSDELCNDVQSALSAFGIDGKELQVFTFIMHTKADRVFSLLQPQHNQHRSPRLCAK